jgi:hypothetical protein
MPRAVVAPQRDEGAVVEPLGLVELSLPVEQGGEGDGVGGDGRMVTP